MTSASNMGLHRSLVTIRNTLSMWKSKPSIHSPSSPDDVGGGVGGLGEDVGAMLVVGPWVIPPHSVAPSTVMFGAAIAMTGATSLMNSAPSCA